MAEESKKSGYPYNLPVIFHFSVAITGYDDDIKFQEVGGLSAEMSVEELVVGGENRFSYKFPVRAKYANLTLKRGVIKDSGLIEWFRKAIESMDFSPVDLTVKLLNEQHEPVAFWDFVQAYPVKWAISDLNATSNALAIETIELAYQYFKRNPKN